MITLQRRATARAELEVAAPQTKESTLLEALVSWGRGKAP